MADEVTVKMTGVEDVMSSIKQLAIASPTAVMRGTLRVAEKIERDAKGACPVLTGRLRASLSTNWTGSNQSRGKVDAKAEADDGVGPPQPKADTFSAVVGTNVEYAPFVEFNESAHHEVGSAHYLYTSYFSHKPEVKDEISLELGRELAKAMKR